MQMPTQRWENKRTRLKLLKFGILWKRPNETGTRISEKGTVVGQYWSLRHSEPGPWGVQILNWEEDIANKAVSLIAGNTVTWNALLPLWQTTTIGEVLHRICWQEQKMSSSTSSPLVSLWHPSVEEPNRSQLTKEKTRFVGSWPKHHKAEYERVGLKLRDNNLIVTHKENRTYQKIFIIPLFHRYLFSQFQRGGLKSEAVM